MAVDDIGGTGRVGGAPRNDRVTEAADEIASEVNCGGSAGVAARGAEREPPQSHLVLHAPSSHAFPMVWPARVDLADAVRALASGSMPRTRMSGLRSSSFIVGEAPARAGRG